MLVFFDLVYSPVYHHFRLEEVVGQIPVGTAESMEGLSPEIARDRGEAWSSYYAGNLRAAIVMGRAAIQRAVRRLGAEEARLKQEINDLVRRGVITESLGRFAHEVRISGDDAAHPEDLGAVSREEAQTSLDFLDDFLRVAVAMPTLADRRRADRKGPTEES
ncbi:MAG TPA: DUF4145 domain-containing protein [Gaiellaceae bacterium]|nr:DUF4145 domain-containing protein [Gaiellaceae bacterium]